MYIAVNTGGASCGAFTTCGRCLRFSGLVQHHGLEEGNTQVLTQIYKIIAISHAF